MENDQEKQELAKVLEKLKETLEKPDGKKKLAKAIYQMIAQPTREKND